MKRVEETGVLRIGFRVDAPPFSFLSDEGEPAGLAVALCKEVAKRLSKTIGGMKSEFIPVTAGKRFDALTEDKTDLHCGPATATLSRREKIDFSLIYFVDGASAVFRKGGPEEVDDLDREPVGVLAGTTTEKAVAALLQNRGIESPLLSFETHLDGLLALQAGEVEAYFADQAILVYQLGRLQLKVPLRLRDEQYSYEPYALAMKRGATELRLAVDRELSGIYDDGSIFAHIKDALGEVTLSPAARSIYGIVGLPY